MKYTLSSFLYAFTAAAWAAVTVTVTDLDGNPIDPETLTGNLIVTFGPEPTDPPDPPDPPEPPEPGSYTWIEIPDSSMASIFDPAIDSTPYELAFNYWPYRAPDVAKIFPHIQEGWSGAAVVGDQICVTGGGHGGSPHNGVFCVDGDGVWERITEPSPIWTTNNDQCGLDESANYRCLMNTGQDCRMDSCAIMPDGAPTSVHSYAGLAGAGHYLFRFGGAPWHASRFEGPRNWALNIETRTWIQLADNSAAGRGSAVHGGDGVFYGSTHAGNFKYNGLNDAFISIPGNGEGYKKFGDMTNMVQCGDHLCAIGQGEAYRTLMQDFPLQWVALPYNEIQNANGPGVVWFEDKLWVWNGGQSFEVYDPHTEAWSTVTPDGPDPGPALGNGTYGRLAVLGDSIYLINGVNANLFRVVSGAPPIDPPDPPDPPIDPPIEPPPAGSVPVVVEDPRGPEWGHTIAVSTVLGPSAPAEHQSCETVRLPCQVADPAVMNDFVRAVDALPNSGGVVLLRPGIHVMTESYKARQQWEILHVQGIPDASGRRPILRSALTYAEQLPDGRYEPPTTKPDSAIRFPKTAKNLVIENLEIQNFSGSCVNIDNSVYDGRDQTVLVKNSFIHHCYFVGFSMGAGPLNERHGSLYILDSELGYIWSGAHMLYFAGGRDFYTARSYYHSPGWHALKVIAWNIAVIDTLMSQSGLEGEPMPQVGAINEGVRIGQGSAASLVACQRGVIRDNVFLQRTGPTAARQRRYDIDGCDFDGSYYPMPGVPLEDPGMIAKYPDEPTQFWLDEFWQAVVSAGSVADGNAMLLPIYWSGNVFEYHRSSSGQARFAVSNSGSYPVDLDKPLEVVPEGWVERSRDLFWNNEYRNYELRYMCDSVDPETSAQCESTVPSFYDERPPFFVTDPAEISPALVEPTVEDLYPQWR